MVLGATGAQLATGEFTNPEVLTAATRGAAAAFALTTPFGSGPEAELEQGRAIIEAAAAARLDHLVFSSVAGATQETGIPHFDSKAAVERVLVASGLPYTIVAPTYFYDNALGGAEQLRRGVLELPLPADQQLQQLDRTDLGSFVELVLRDLPAFAGRRIELASDAPTPAQMSQALAAALGRPVRFDEVPMSAVRQGSPDMAAMWGPSVVQLPVAGERDAIAAHGDHPVGVPENSFIQTGRETSGVRCMLAPRPVTRHFTDVEMNEGRQTDLQQSKRRYTTALRRPFR